MSSKCPIILTEQLYLFQSIWCDIIVYCKHSSRLIRRYFHHRCHCASMRTVGCCSNEKPVVLSHSHGTLAQPCSSDLKSGSTAANVAGCSCSSWQACQYHYPWRCSSWPEWNFCSDKTPKETMKNYGTNMSLSFSCPPIRSVYFRKRGNLCNCSLDSH